MKKTINIPYAIKQLEIVTKNLVTTKLIGDYKSIFKGRGLEFDSYREYTEQDDSSLIDWKASSRVNKLLVKQFVEERNLDVFFLVDTSSTMLFGSTEKLKIEYATELVASLSYIILRSGDKVGLAIFNNNIVKLLPLQQGNKQFFIISNTLVNQSFYGGPYNISNAIKFLMKYLKKGTMLIIVSDFLGLEDNWQNSIKNAAQKFDVISMMIRDPRDRSLPPNYKVVLEDPYSDSRIIIDSNKIRQQYQSYVNQEETNIKKSFLNSRADFLLLSTDQSFFEPLLHFFRERQRRWH